MHRSENGDYYSLVLKCFNLELYIENYSYCLKAKCCDIVYIIFPYIW